MNKKELLALLEPYDDEDQIYLKLYKGYGAYRSSINSVGKENCDYSYWYTNNFQENKIIRKTDQYIFISADVPESD